MRKIERKSSASIFKALLSASILTISPLTYASNDEHYLQVSFEFLVGLFLVLLLIVFAPLLIMFISKRKKHTLTRRSF